MNHAAAHPTHNGGVAALPESEVGFKVTPSASGPSLESKFAASLDALVRRSCQLARALIGANQAAIQVWITNQSQARKYFSLCEQYAAFRDFQVNPKGIGLHGMQIPPGEVVRLTQAEVLSHPLYHGFVPFADVHPPMRGWLATSICGQDGRAYGLLQLSDKSDGRDFDEIDEANIRALAALIGPMLDGLRLAAGAD
jgi:GAF domain-containing protein